MVAEISLSITIPAFGAVGVGQYCHGSKQRCAKRSRRQWLNCEAAPSSVALALVPSVASAWLSGVSPALSRADFAKNPHENALCAGSFVAKGRPPRVRGDVSWDHARPGFCPRRKKVAMTRLILELVRPYRWIIAFILTAMLIQTAMSLAGPWPLKVILDDVVIAKHPLPHWMTDPAHLG
jgi:hypothetical protein